MEGPDVLGALDRGVDPVGQAREYQELLLGLVADRDPAEIQAEQPAQLAELIERAGGNLRKRPAPGEWSVAECAGHMLDAELVSAARYRWIIAQDRPTMIGYDQDLWVESLAHQDDDPAETVALFSALRRANLEMWARVPKEMRARVGMHAERGPESYELTFRLVAGHGIFHFAQADGPSRLSAQPDPKAGSGLLAGLLDQFYEHPAKALRVDERHRCPARSGPGALVHQRDSGSPEGVQRGRHVVDPVPDVMQPLSAPLEESPHRGLRTGRREQLDV